MQSIINSILKDEILTFMIFTFAYLTYFFSYDSKLVKNLAKKFGDQEGHKEFAIHIPRILGFLLLGVAPLILIKLFYTKKTIDFGLSLPHGEYTLTIAVCSVLLFILVSIFRSGKNIDKSYYPQVRVDKWDKPKHILNVISWSLYLFGYEFMIRGVLFFSCYYAYGLTVSVIINSTIYSLIHIFKGKQEAFGAFPLGIIFCLIAYYTHSMMLPFILHVILAEINDLKAIKSNKYQQVI